MGWFCRTASQALQNLASVTTDTLPVFLPFHSPFPPSKQCRWVSSLIACFASRCASRGRVGRVHSVLAVSARGVPLGLLHQQVWARDPAQTGKKQKRKQV